MDGTAVIRVAMVGVVGTAVEATREGPEQLLSDDENAGAEHDVAESIWSEE